MDYLLEYIVTDYLPLLDSVLVAVGILSVVMLVEFTTTGCCIKLILFMAFVTTPTHPHTHLERNLFMVAVVCSNYLPTQSTLGRDKLIKFPPSSSLGRRIVCSFC